MAVAKETFERHASAYVFSEETGESGTPHLQGAVQFKTRVRFTFVKKLFDDWGVHWEKCKGSWKQNVEYCTKVGDWSKIHGNIPEASRYTFSEKAVLDARYKDVVWKPWQARIIALVDTEPHPRTIHWFWEETGNIGKTYLARWLCIQYRCQMADGKRADIYNGIAKAMEADPKAWPQLILLDIPRSSLEYVNYGAIEQMKNGFIFSGKYEGAQLIFLEPHVIVFSNAPPDRSKMSVDRWKVVEIQRPRMPEVVRPPGMSRVMIP